MAGRLRALTCAQEPRCSRHDNPAFAACPQGFLSSAMAVPHNDSRRRNAVASLVYALLAASNALMDAATGAAAGPGTDGLGGGEEGVTSAGNGTAVAGGGRTRLPTSACQGANLLCHSSQPPEASSATLTRPSAAASQTYHTRIKQPPLTSPAD